MNAASTGITSAPAGMLRQAAAAWIFDANGRLTPWLGFAFEGRIVGAPSVPETREIAEIG